MGILRYNPGMFRLHMSCSVPSTCSGESSPFWIGTPPEIETCVLYNSRMQNKKRPKGVDVGGSLDAKTMFLSPPFEPTNYIYKKKCFGYQKRI